VLSILTALGCGGGSDNPGTANRVLAAPSPIVISQFCAVWAGPGPIPTGNPDEPLSTSEPPTSEPPTPDDSLTELTDVALSPACVPLARPVQFDFSPLPIVTPDLDQIFSQFALVGCMESADVSTGFGLVPIEDARGLQTSDDPICDLLAKTGDSRGSAGSVPDVGSTMQRVNDACTKDLLQGPNVDNPRPILGPETVRSQMGTVKDVATDLRDRWNKLSPETKIMVGAGLLFVVGPTVGIVAVYVAEGGTSVVLLWAAKKAIVDGATMMGAGIYDKATENGGSPEPLPEPGSETTPREDIPDPPSGSATVYPSPDAEQAPNECMKALATAASCATRKGCDDPELADSLEAIRIRQCESKVLVGPDDPFCTNPYEVTEAQFAAALVSVCRRWADDKKPDPDQPGACPFMAAAATGAVRPSMLDYCLRVMGDVVDCPQMGDPKPSG